MKKEKNWLSIFCIVFFVSQMSYLVTQETFPWRSDLIFRILFPIGILLLGSGVYALYTKFLYTKMTPAKYSGVFTTIVMVASFVLLIPLINYPGSGDILVFGIYLSGYLMGLFFLILDIQSSNE